MPDSALIQVALDLQKVIEANADEIEAQCTMAKPFAAMRTSAGRFAPLGVAHEEEGGDRLSGRWQFASGSGHAEHMGGGTVIMRDGAPAPMGENDNLPLIGLFVPAERAKLTGKWGHDGPARKSKPHAFNTARSTTELSTSSIAVHPMPREHA